MELIDSSSKCHNSRDKDDVEAAIDLFDEYWFFGNLLHRRLMMFRSSSDPYPSTSSMTTYQDINGGQYSSSLLTHHEDDFVRHNLRRTPSLPPHIGREEAVRDKEIVRSRLSRQTSLTSPVVSVLPPLPISKSMTPSPSIQRHRTRRESKVMEITSKDNINRPRIGKESIYGNLISHKKISKSLSELEFEEVQGFKDLGFVFDKNNLNPSVVNIIPGLQGKKQVDDKEDKVRRPYLSEAWLVQRTFPQIPYWIDQRDTGDVKAQLKFWARAVASNVRQEC